MAGHSSFAIWTPSKYSVLDATPPGKKNCTIASFTVPVKFAVVKFTVNVCHPVVRLIVWKLNP